MKKTSTASFIVAIVLVVASIALFILGALNVNATQVYSRIGNGYSYMRVSYNFSLARIANGFMMILLGGFTFLGGILLFILAAVTRPAKPNCAVECCTAKPTQAPSPSQPDVVETAASCCNCTADSSATEAPSSETEN